LTLHFTPEAHRDLQEILAYIAERSPPGAVSVQFALHRIFRLIEEFPESGRLAGEQAVRALKAGPYPYLVYWSVEQGEPWIVHIRHAKRAPWPKVSE
jgi:plasmid stabilization system protein ParE